MKIISLSPHHLWRKSGNFSAHKTFLQIHSKSLCHSFSPSPHSSCNVYVHTCIRCVLILAYAKLKPSIPARIWWTHGILIPTHTFSSQDSPEQLSGFVVKMKKGYILKQKKNGTTQICVGGKSHHNSWRFLLSVQICHLKKLTWITFLKTSCQLQVDFRKSKFNLIYYRSCKDEVWFEHLYNTNSASAWIFVFYYYYFLHFSTVNH